MRKGDDVNLKRNPIILNSALAEHLEETMCLSKVNEIFFPPKGKLDYPNIIKPEQCFKGYKVLMHFQEKFRKYDKNAALITTPIMESPTLTYDEWIITNGSVGCTSLYPTGFHIFKQEKDAMDYLIHDIMTIDNPYSIPRVFKVYYNFIVATGKQTLYGIGIRQKHTIECDVALQMFIPKPSYGGIPNNQ